MVQYITRHEVHKITLPDNYFGTTNSYLYMSLNLPSATTCIVTNLQPQTKYYFIIVYVRNDTRSYSEMKWATTLGCQATSKVSPFPAEIRPPNLFIIPPTTAFKNFKVQWTGNNAVAYDVQYKIEISGEWTDWLTNTSQKEAVFPALEYKLTRWKNVFFSFQSQGCLWCLGRLSCRN